MKLVEKFEQAQGPFYTFEFFPPRTEQVSPDIVISNPGGGPIESRGSAISSCEYLVWQI